MFEKYGKFLPLCLFAAFVLKGLFTGITYADSATYFVLGTIAGFYEWGIQNRRMEVLHARMNECDKHLTTLYKQNEELKSSLASAKLMQTYRPTQVK